MPSLQESGPGSSGGEGGPQNGGPDLDNMKSSPATAPTTPREGDQNIEFNMANFPQGENVSSYFLLNDLNGSRHSQMKLHYSTKSAQSIKIAVTFEPIRQFKNISGFRMS